MKILLTVCSLRFCGKKQKILSSINLGGSIVLKIIMINILEVSKLQDKLNITTEQVPCASCGNTSTKNNKVYIIVIKPHGQESYLPLCKNCLEQLNMAFELETLPQEE